MLATCLVTDFLIGQHLIIHPLNNYYLNCTLPFIVSQLTEFVLQPKVVFSSMWCIDSGRGVDSVGMSKDRPAVTAHCEKSRQMSRLFVKENVTTCEKMLSQVI